MSSNWLPELCEFDAMYVKAEVHSKFVLMGKPTELIDDGRRYKPLRDLAPQPIGLLNRQRNVLRLFKACRLYCTTRYSWKLSWHQAAR